MSVRDCIAAGVYDDLPYPVKPKMALMLRTNAMLLSDVEIAQLPEVKKKYEKDLVLYAVEKSNYDTDRVVKHKKFENDLAIEHGVASHKHRKRVFDMAWAQGHDEGLDRVAQIYEDLAELLK